MLIRNGRVIDPANGVDMTADLGIRDGSVVCVSTESGLSADRVIDAAGYYVMPGLVDLHVHLSSEFNGAAGHAMLARAGVTTALDVAGPVEDVLTIAGRHGSGLTIGCLERIRPGERVPSDDPNHAQIDEAITGSMAAGAIGVKILGGHFPLTPDASARVIAAANVRRAYVAFHAGTKETGSDIHGLREALELARGMRIHMAHINAYCRGTTMEPTAEAQAAVAMLRDHATCFSESYLAPINGTWADCHDGIPVSKRTKACLEAAGYLGTAEGLERALMDGVAHLHVVAGDNVELRSGVEAVELWRAQATRGAVSFSVNPPEPRLLLALSRDARGNFDVDALATDGGGIPRNDVIMNGLRLVGLGALSLADLVRKACVIPANVLGVPEKGHLAPGADADIAIVDPAIGQVSTTIANGRVVMHRGIVFGTGSTWLSTEAGAQRVKSAGCKFRALNLADSGFYAAA